MFDGSKKSEDRILGESSSDDGKDDGINSTPVFVKVQVIGTNSLQVSLELSVAQELAAPTALVLNFFFQSLDTSAQVLLGLRQGFK